MAEQKRVTKKSDMTPEQLAAYEKARGPRPAYIAYSISADGTLEVGAITRSAEEVLAAVDANRDLKYVRVMIK